MVSLNSSADLCRVKDAVPGDVDESAFSDVSEADDPAYVWVNERPRFGPAREAQKAAYKEKKRLEELERQKRIEEAIRRREEEEQRRLERGEVESESGLSDSEDEEVLDTASVDTETTCTPTSSQSAATTLKVPEKEATLASTGAVAKTLLHELKGLASAESLAVLARGSALSAVRSLKN
ncbi:unnamed protein product [Durusdinium trenchii]|uniref:Uncharacterized protein n=1 Tax=Durusdinium trenchii TaxID=1381693 RepID=A0ABP0MXS7_9DINO